MFMAAACLNYRKGKAVRTQLKLLGGIPTPLKNDGVRQLGL